MIKFKFLIVLAMMSVVFAACSSNDDGTRFVHDIDLVSKMDLDAGNYPGKYKITTKDKDSSYDYFYTNTSYTIGDNLTFVLISRLEELEEAKALLEISEANVAVLESALAVLTDFKAQIKALLAEVEENEN